MKRKVIAIILLTLSMLTFASCGKKEDAAEDTQADAIADAMSTFGDPEGQATPEEEPQEQVTPNHFIQNVAELADPWSGTIAIGDLVLDGKKTFDDIQRIMPSTYSLAYVKVERGDGAPAEATTAIGDPTTIVPKSGEFEAAYAPTGITNASDARMIKFVFGVPYDTAGNPRHLNKGKWSIDKFKVQEIKFMVHRTDGSETGVGFTVPGFNACVSTKEDMTKAFGTETKIAEASNNIKFYKEGTPFNDIRGSFVEGDETGNLTEVSVMYDVNFGEDLTLIGVTGSNLGNFGSFVENVPAGNYYGFYRDDMQKPIYAFEAEPDAVDQTNLVAYSVAVTGLRGGVYYSYDYVNSSQVDNMPVKMPDAEHLFVASADQVIKIKINVEDGVLEVESMASRLYSEEDGSTYYEITNGDETVTGEESTEFDAMMSEYEAAAPISVELKN